MPLVGLCAARVLPEPRGSQTTAATVAHRPWLGSSQHQTRDTAHLAASRQPHVCALAVYVQRSQAPEPTSGHTCHAHMPRQHKQAHTPPAVTMCEHCAPPCSHRRCSQLHHHQQSILPAGRSAWPASVCWGAHHQAARGSLATAVVVPLTREGCLMLWLAWCCVCVAVWCGVVRCGEQWQPPTCKAAPGHASAPGHMHHSAALGTQTCDAWRALAGSPS
jgi:hypothetical protein